MDRCFGCENEHLRATIQTLTQERDALREAAERIDVISLHAVNRMNEVDGMRAIRRECKALKL